MLISLALIITLIVLVFARDVSRSAHGAITERRSENKSFAALANALIGQENVFDRRFDGLVTRGDTLRRTVFDARLSQLNDELPGWLTEASLLRSPSLAHKVNETFYELTSERADAYEALIAEIADALGLPWTTTSDQHVTDPTATLISTSTRWSSARFALAKEPGRMKLDGTTSHAAAYLAAHGLSALLSSPSLALVRAISIAAIRVSPAPLPSSPGVLLLPPVTTVEFGVSVLNASYDDQPVTLIITVTPANPRRKAYAARMHATLGPLEAYAFVPPLLTTAASERAEVVITVSGARAAAGKVTREDYRLEMSPSGNG